MEIKEEVFESMKEALECANAMILPCKESQSIFEKYGYSDNKYNYSYADFVDWKIKEALTQLRNM